MTNKPLEGRVVKTKEELTTELYDLADHRPDFIVNYYVELYKKGVINPALAMILIDASCTGKSLIDEVGREGLTIEQASQAQVIYERHRQDLLIYGIENNALMDGFSEWMTKEAKELSKLDKLDKDKVYNAVKKMLDDSAKSVFSVRRNPRLNVNKIAKHPYVFCYGLLENMYKTEDVDVIIGLNNKVPLKQLDPPLFDSHGNISKLYEKASKNYVQYVIDNSLFNNKNKGTKV
jgi:hypothetical protein